MPDRPRVGVAFSGGRDSTALLHATLGAAAALGIDVVALHVNHRLSPDANRWQSRAAAVCRRWARAGAPLAWMARRLPGEPPVGASVEAWAREQRYAALSDMARAQGVSLVLLAHHRSDQAETFLLQALRGGGVAGLAAMPRCVRRDGIDWVRPWIAVSRGSIDAYLQQHRLTHVTDPSNADARFARSRLRHAVMPSLLAAFPTAEASLARAAAHLHEAADALTELAQLDLADVAGPDGLQLEPWLALSPARRSNALRHWLRSRLGLAASAALVARLLREWPAGRGWREWPCTGGRLVAWHGLLRIDAIATGAAAPSVEPVRMRIAEPGHFRVPDWRGWLDVTEVAAGGVAWGSLAMLCLSGRGGGEDFQSAPNRPARSLKKQFQAAGVPPERRVGPLIWAGDRLLYVAGLGHDARALAPPGVRQALLRWIAEPASQTAAAAASSATPDR